MNDAVLARLRPTPEEEAALLADAAATRLAAQEALDRLGVAGAASIQGSIAKGTWLHGHADIDIFLLLDPDTPEQRLGPIAVAVGEAVLDAPRQRYAQHPYIVGEHRGRTVDLVPAYRIPDATARMSAVDRTPFHTAWVREHLDAPQRDAVRLLKGFLRGTETYGAQTAVGGLSGYLAEVLVHLHGHFDGVIEWLARDATPRRLAAGADHVDQEAPLIVVDPVDPARNCAAAVHEEVLQQAIDAARAFCRSPHERFFFPPPPRLEPPRRLRAALQQQRACWLGMILEPQTDRLDIVLPQFQRAARRAAAALTAAGFRTRRQDVAVLEDGRVGMQWVVDDVRLPASTRHQGPPADSPHAARFRAKWQDHADAMGAVEEEGGRLVVQVAVPHRTPAAWLAHHLDVLTGRHVAAALTGPPGDDPGAADAAWAPRVADVVLDRRPWQR